MGYGEILTQYRLGTGGGESDSETERHIIVTGPSNHQNLTIVYKRILTLPWIKEIQLVRLPTT